MPDVTFGERVVFGVTDGEGGFREYNPNSTIFCVLGNKSEIIRGLVLTVLYPSGRITFTEYEVGSADPREKRNLK